ncbi:a9c026ea-1566-4ab4-8f3d-2c626e435796 [Thermothielavioides terrestris]|uniref:A9c026ea-1566-4ab4-8f3d-2c626e435796 n=2 Tax=Thermothielavioides terrestris TaxID=2587410 RepID=A0A446BT09_9PEZI|nr:a9c026ea-1566-4ab4-8f3d-2c626e435796 [Thermothielavioides terrestris]
MVRLTIAALLTFAAAALAITPNNAGAKNVGNGKGEQFITGGCVNDADCSSGCCANASGVGVCSAEAAQFQNGKQGCHFVDPNAAATIAAAKAQVQKQGFEREVNRLRRGGRI